MIVNTKRMARAAVLTKSGTRLGTLASIDIDGDTGKLSAIRVNPKGRMMGLLLNELTVASSQVLSMTEEEVVVEDASVPVTARPFAANVGTAFTPAATGTPLQLKKS